MLALLAPCRRRPVSRHVAHEIFLVFVPTARDTFDAVRADAVSVLLPGLRVIVHVTFVLVAEHVPDFDVLPFRPPERECFFSLVTGFHVAVTFVPDTFHVTLSVAYGCAFALADDALLVPTAFEATTVKV